MIEALPSHTRTYSNSSVKTYPAYTFKLIILLILPILFLTNAAYSSTFYDCPDNFYAGTPPDYLDDKIQRQSIPLCFDGFATLYSGISRTPIWSAEHLTRDRLSKAETIERDDSFHSESRLPSSMRSALTDYKGSGYDRGHLAPNADMASHSQQYDSFSLANIIPQAPSNNRYIWRNIESVTRHLTMQYGETYVISGVAFEGDKIAQIGNGVLVPTHVFKAIYIPATGEAGVYYAANDDSERIEIISIDTLALRSTVDVFPAIDSASKAKALDLPLKTTDFQQENDTSANDPWWLILLVVIIEWLVEVLFS